MKRHPESPAGTSPAQVRLAAAPQAILQQAAAMLGQGQNEAAESLCREALSVPLIRSEALHLLGVLELRTGRASLGIQHLNESLGINPNQPVVHTNLGHALLESGRSSEALDAFDRALTLSRALPLAFYGRANALKKLDRLEEALAGFDAALRLQMGFPQAHNNRGNVLRALRRAEEALASFDQAIALDPTFADAHVNRGNTLLELGRHQDALQSYERACALAPNDPLPSILRGNVLRQLTRPQEALRSYESALRTTPSFVAALHARASLLVSLGRLAEALESIDAALRVNPRDFEALDSRGNILRGIGRHAEALIAFEQALSIEPKFGPALNNRGAALGDCERFDEAIASYEAALSVAPDRPEVLLNLAAAHLAVANAQAQFERFGIASFLLKKLLQIEPEREYALGLLSYAQRCDCDWSGHDEAVIAIESRVSQGKRADTPFGALGVLGSAQAQLRCARTFADDRHPAQPPLWRGEHYAHRRIRLAYVSSDLRDHAVGRLLLPVLENHDLGKFETFGIALRPPDTTATGRRIVEAFEHYFDASKEGEAQIAQRIRDLEVDIAIDLNGYTAGGRPGIFSHRAAPVQVSYLGYAGTSGTSYVDYLIADSVVISPDHERDYSEQVVRMPGCFLPCGIPRDLNQAVPSREQAGLPENGLVLCAFNNSYKISPRIFDIWCRLVCALPGSVLWLRDWGSAMRANLVREAQHRGVVSERLIFAGHLSSGAEHLARHRLADLFLDTLPYNAHSTVYDALWAGVPVLTCRGDTFAGRVAASILIGSRLPELVTGNLSEYERRAFELAGDPARLVELRHRIAALQTGSPLFDRERYCAQLEAAYTQMWERSQRGQPARGFYVQALS